MNARTPQLRQVQRTTHRNDLFALRSRMPVRPLPGERNFTGVPPVSAHGDLDVVIKAKDGHGTRRKRSFAS